MKHQVKYSSLIIWRYDEIALGAENVSYLPCRVAESLVLSN